MARLSLSMLAVINELCWGHRGESEAEQAQLAIDQDAESAESPYYYYEKPGWENTTTDEVKKLVSVQFKMRQNFAPDVWNQVASKSMHMMIATTMLDNLKNAKHVVDIGSGTGALLAVFAELVPKSAVVEGLEYSMKVADAARQKMEKASLLFKNNGIADAQMVANKISKTGIAGGDLNGNLFTFNLKGERDGEFDVINVGFAMNENEIPGVLWKALAANGKLGMPICDATSNGAKCDCHYHIFTKTSMEAVFPLKQLQGSEHTIIKNGIQFMLARPPPTQVQVQEGYERIECPTDLARTSCKKFSEEVPLPKDGALFVKKVLTDGWTDLARTTGGGYQQEFRTAHREERIWAGDDEHDAPWGLKVIFDMYCEQQYSELSWKFSGFGDLQSMGNYTVTNKGNFGDCS